MHLGLNHRAVARWQANVITVGRWSSASYAERPPGAGGAAGASRWAGPHPRPARPARSPFTCSRRSR